MNERIEGLFVNGKLSGRGKRYLADGRKTLHTKHPNGREVALQTREVFDVARVYDSAAA